MPAKLVGLAISLAVSAAVTAAQLAIQLLTQKPVERGKFEGKLNVQDSQAGLPISIVYGGEYTLSPSYAPPYELDVAETAAKVKILWEQAFTDATARQVSFVYVRGDADGDIVSTTETDWTSASGTNEHVIADPAPATWVVGWVRVRLGYDLPGGGTVWREARDATFYRDPDTTGTIATHEPAEPSFW